MGLQNREQGGNYITILGGKFSQRVDANTPGAVQRVNKLGKTVFEKYYTEFTGKLVGIKTQDSKDYGKNWIFSFQDGGQIYNLQLSYSNSFATALLKMLPNVDLNQEMRVQPVAKEVDGKTKSSLFISQGGTTIKHAYTMDNKNGLPDMEKVMVKGQEVWDDSKRLEFLYNMVQSDIIPKLPKAEETVAAPAEHAASIEDIAGDDAAAGDDDDF